MPVANVLAYAKPTSVSGLPGVDSADANHSDTVNLTNGPCRAIWVGVGGNIKLRTLGGHDELHENIPGGYMFKMGAQRIFATGTTALKLKAIY